MSQQPQIPERPDRTAEGSEATTFELTKYRMAVIQIGVLATTIANALFAVSRFIDSTYSQRPTPWWINAASFLLLVLLYRWFTRKPTERIVFTIHVTGFVATIALLVPLAYGMASSVWWLSLIGLAAILMANFRAAVFWCTSSWLLIAIAPAAVAHLAPTLVAHAEPELEATLSRLFFPLVAFAIAYTFRVAVRQQSRDLRTVAAKLATSDNAKGRFLRHIGHEFRTPLHALLASTEQALSNESNLDQRSRIESARASAQLLLSQVNQVIEFASGVAEPRQRGDAAFSPKAAVQRCLSGLQEAALSMHTKLEAVIGTELANSYRGDALAFEQLLTGLASNAVRLTAEGQVTIHIEPSADCGLRLMVSDSGPGMTPEQVVRVFEPFGQVDESSTRSPQGLGLGLPYMRKLSVELGGSLVCESVLGRGTKMIVELPFVAASSNAKHLAPAAQTTEPKSAMLLVCEDDPACRDLLVAGLQSLGHRTVEASDGVDAVSRLGEQSFDAVISDLEMPRMDGYGLLKHIRSCSPEGTPPSLPVVLVTASATADNSRRFVDEGFAAVLPKPFMLSEMQSALSQVLAGDDSADSVVS